MDGSACRFGPARKERFSGFSILGSGCVFVLATDSAPSKGEVFVLLSGSSLRTVRVQSALKVNRHGGRVHVLAEMLDR